MKDLGIRPTIFMFGGAPMAHEVLPEKDFQQKPDVRQGD
jgi:hypothetical protein